MNLQWFLIYSFLLLISLLVRFPRTEHIVGSDTYYLMNQAILLTKGELVSLIHPLSALGLYAFSPYPIGSLISFAVMWIISGQNLITATWLYISVFVTLSLVTSVRLFSLFFKDYYMKYVLALIYVNLPFIVNYSHYLSSARLPFYAIMPLVFYYFYQFAIKRSWGDLLLFVLFVGLSFLFHRMAMAFALLAPLLLFPIFGGVIAKKEDSMGSLVKIKQTIDKWYIELFMVLMVGFTLLGYFIADYYGIELSSNIITNSRSIAGFLGIVVSQNYVAKLGPILLLASFGIFYVKKQSINGNSSLLAYLKYSLLIILVYTPFVWNIYSPYMIEIPFIVLTGLMLQDGPLKSRIGLLSIIIFASFFVFGYIFIDLVFSSLDIFAILGPSLGILSCILYIYLTFDRSIKLEKYIRFKRTNILKAVIVFMLLFHSYFYVNFQLFYLPLDPYQQPKTITTDEMEVIDYLKDKNCTFDSYSQIIGARVALFSGCIFLADRHDISLLQNGVYSPQEVLESSRLRPIPLWLKQHVFGSSLSRGIDFHMELIELNATSTRAQFIIEFVKLEYFISGKGTNISESWRSSHVHSLFIQTLPLVATVAHETETLTLWHIDI